MYNLSMLTGKQTSHTNRHSFLRLLRQQQPFQSRNLLILPFCLSLLILSSCSNNQTQEEQQKQNSQTEQRSDTEKGETDSEQQTEKSSSTPSEQDSQAEQQNRQAAENPPTFLKHADNQQHLQRFQSGDPEQIRMAAEYFDTRSDAEKIALFEYALTADLSLKRTVAFYLMSHFRSGDQKLLEIYISLLDDDDPEVRKISLRALRSMPELLTPAQPLLQKIALNDSEEDLKVDALRLLGRIPLADEGAFRTWLSRLLEHPASSRVRIASLYTAERVNDSQTFQALAAELLSSSPHIDVKKYLCIRLGKMDQLSENTVAILGDQLLKSDPTIAKAACDVLIQQQRAALPHLQQGLNASDPELRMIAIYGLGKLRGIARPALPQLKELQESATGEEAQLIQAVISAIGP